MQLDTTKNGLASIFKEWQVPLVEELLISEPMGSKEAYEYLGKIGVKGQKELGSISRASVINFLNDLVDKGLLDFSLVTGKGGHRRIYTMAMTREEFAHKIIGKFVNKLIEAFPKEIQSFWPES